MAKQEKFCTSLISEKDKNANFINIPASCQILSEIFHFIFVSTRRHGKIEVTLILSLGNSHQFYKYFIKKILHVLKPKCLSTGLRNSRSVFLNLKRFSHFVEDLLKVFGIQKNMDLCSSSIVPA